ncbi:uncharacterized protein LOC100370881 [Saccoglossus kowalevskii]|uniref:Uncharacterized protein LOC100370881 n=1 Tax=Saccoglossus kowalevskii TaxID=10224 RepID=A0ABM0H0P2_SACKO|nr:PREDICTED: uncharacterized protein LOC100370881 [Saccoglossus kowalevskii]
MVESNIRKIGVTSSVSNARHCRLALREIEDIRFCWGMCCGPGLVTGIVTCVYFLLLLPAGLFLIMVGGQKKLEMVPFGVILVVVPVIAFSIYISLKWYRSRHGVTMPSSSSSSSMRCLHQTEIDQNNQISTIT